MAGDAAFLNALVINTVLFLVFVALFCWLRPRYHHFYHPRLHRPPSISRNIPDPPGWFGWVVQAVRFSDNDIYELCGMDALIYTLFLRFGIFVFACCSVFGLAVLIPINYTAGGPSQCVASDGSIGQCSGGTATGLNRITLSNVPEGDVRVWAHLVSAYVYVAIVHTFLFRLYRKFIKYRMRFYKEGRPQFYNVLVRDIPAEDSATTEAFERKVRDVFGDEVLGTNLIANADQLRTIIKGRDAALLRLEHIRAEREVKPDKKPPTTRVGGFLCFGGKIVPEEQHLREKIENFNQAIVFHQQIINAQPEPVGAGFVAFDSMATAASAHQTLISERPFSWTIDPAPEARDVHWANCKIGYQQRYIRQWIFDIATFLLVFFWVIPVAFVASLTTLQALSDRLPFLNPIFNASPVIRGFLEGFIPSLALIIFMALLPKILKALSAAQGIHAHSLIHFSAVRKMFWFQVINVFLVSIVAGSAFAALSSMISSPGSIPKLLGAAIPVTSFFFTNLVMLQALTLFPGDLLRPIDLIIYKIKYKYFAPSRIEKDATWAPQQFDYIMSVPAQLLVLLVGLTYATVAPIILPFACLFFVIGYVIHRHNLVHIHEPDFESGGLLFPTIFNRVMGTLVLYEITLIGIFGLKLVIGPPILMLPLIVITLYFWRSMNVHAIAHQPQVYQRLALVVPRETAQQVGSHKLMHSRTEYRIPELAADPHLDVEHLEASRAYHLNNQSELREPNVINAG